MCRLVKAVVIGIKSINMAAERNISHYNAASTHNEATDNTEQDLVSS
jgi:hypothetical protein